MSYNAHLTVTVRAAALALAILAPAGATFAQQSTLEQIYQPGANNAFGAQSQQQALRAAGGAPVTVPLTVEQGRTQYSRTASTVPTAGEPRDVLGAGGRQDELAREIYQPGSRPAGW
jgi:hypothetical protein